jgi:hypothetical protein
MRSSMPLEVILLLYFFVCAFVVKARVESDEERERERERTDQDGVEFFLLSFEI